MANKKFYALMALMVIGAGCDAQNPEYLKVIPATELHRIMESQDIFLVDVHTPEQRHIKGTDKFIPYDAIERFKDQLPQDKNAAIYLYCEGGPMGKAAAKTLHEMGYGNLFNLEGGTVAWRKNGFAFE